MHYTELYAAADGQSHFREHIIELPHRIDLGDYSNPFTASNVLFWSFEAGNATDWHTAPQQQFVILLTGRIAIETHGGERREFQAGDILLANNLNGEGHRTQTLEAGSGMLIPKDRLGERLQLLTSTLP